GQACCSGAGDCPSTYGGHNYVYAASCDNGATCQGHRYDKGCSSNRCQQVYVDDDSACSWAGGANSSHRYVCGFSNAAVPCHASANQDTISVNCSDKCARVTATGAVCTCDADGCPGANDAFCAPGHGCIVLADPATVINLSCGAGTAAVTCNSNASYTWQQLC